MEEESQAETEDGSNVTRTGRREKIGGEGWQARVNMVERRRRWQV